MRYFQQFVSYFVLIFVCCCLLIFCLGSAFCVIWLGCAAITCVDLLVMTCLMIIVLMFDYCKFVIVAQILFIFYC